MQKIPKILHWCWFGDKPMPQVNQDCVKTWREILPDFIIQFWNEKNFDVRRCKFAADAYDTGNYAFVSDYARWWVLQQYGGIYVDSDVRIIKDLTSLLHNSAFGGVSNGGMFASGLILGSVPDGLVVNKMVEMYDSLRFCTAKGEPIFVNCTIRETELLEGMGFDIYRADRFQIVGDMTIFPKEYFCGYNPETGEMYANAQTFAIHQFSGTWMPEWMRQKQMETNQGYKKHYQKIYGNE